MENEIKEMLMQILDKLDAIDSKLNILDLKQDRNSKMLDDLWVEIKLSEKKIHRSIANLKD